MNILTKAISKAFIEQNIDEEDEITVYEPKELGKIFDIPVTEIRPNPSQPRKHFDTKELTSLAKSISQDGIVQPLSVRRTEKGYELISGERRLRAAKLAGIRSVPCIIVNVNEKRSDIISLVENIQRANLNFFEEANAISALMEKYRMTQEEIAVRLGFAQSTVANKLRLLKLTPSEQNLIVNNGLTERHARAVLKIQDETERRNLLEKIVENNWTVSETDKYIKRMEKEKIRKEDYKKRAVMLKDIRLFFNTVNKAVDVMKLAGVNADTKRIDHDDYIEYIIKIPNKKEEK